MSNLSPNSIESVFKDSYQQLVFASYNYVEDVQKAEDIVQEVFLKMLNHKDLSSIEYLKAYIKKSVINDSLKSIKASRKTISLEVKHVDTIQFKDSEETAIINREDRSEILEKLAILPPGCRKVFLSCVLDGLKYKEASELHEISINTVKTQVKKAYKLLRASYSEFYLFIYFKNCIFFD